ncbi:uncharacterized protein BDCG_01990 [Blastomyces dermatitidis ER-3]|uniref:Uncharacterized protein n=2 Tax=Blastomyces TaxID=229219 RepID=A0A179UIJ6_BLAGS|nr:uncharacterized protein BDBG_03913 [Blastomyces gilchristii SLH14081]XP_045274324.1 uncharacterized protein BDCG_01990 [Blastomyces dermatitidis ER-3]EEQ86870.2 hypothetical protein BDCG_01990 [Blastomyces dermatitidis ER-3]EQL34192.1 hypothetical protein BDFG_03862 [Blastomyces dermatitidis ATCC 26199]OAT07896.1 hypothetical protein BDBG_03913 [Blastomyces gilchristii SLH14081]
MKFSLVVLCVLSTAITTATAKKRWYGTAPFCNARCPRDEKPFCASTSNDDGTCHDPECARMSSGQFCAFGTVKLCCEE